MAAKCPAVTGPRAWRLSAGAGSRTSHRSAARLLGLAALCIFAFILVPQVQAQREIWSGTLTVREFSGILGCHNAVSLCSSTSNLSDDDFTYDGTTYTLTNIHLSSNGSLEIHFDRNVTGEAAALTLVVGTDKFAFENGAVTNRAIRSWRSTGLSWTAGRTVNLRVTETLVPPSSLVAAPYGDDAVLLSWAEPDSGNSPSGYKIDSSAAGGST